MLERLTIKNFKSIVDVDVELGRINLFIGENGCGKTNLLEALAMLSAAKTGTLDNEELYSRGIRVAKPAMTFSSFAGLRSKEQIRIQATFPGARKVVSILSASNPDDIYATWRDEEVLRSASRMLDEAISIREEDSIRLIKESYSREHAESLLGAVEKLTPAQFLVAINQIARTLAVEVIDAARRLPPPLQAQLDNYLIYSLNTHALRGIHVESRKLPLGIHGEGLDLLISQLTAAERKQLVEYSHFISWLEDILVDPEDQRKFEGHKLGKSTSTLYFKDRFMRRRNNVFSAENANEGILHVLFYLTLFISGRTPRLFGIDNIETALNPQLCRSLMKELATLAKRNDKQALITTHNPAVLDGLNLHDDEQRLFVVYRSDEGHTRVKRIQLKEKAEVDGRALKLSEMWMRGLLGGLPTNF